MLVSSWKLEGYCHAEQGFHFPLAEPYRVIAQVLALFYLEGISGDYVEGYAMRAVAGQ